MAPCLQTTDACSGVLTLVSWALIFVGLVMLHRHHPFAAFSPASEASWWFPWTVQRKRDRGGRAV